MVLVTDDSSLDQDSSSIGDRKWLNSKWNLKVEPKRFAKRHKVECAKEMGVQDLGFTKHEE